MQKEKDKDGILDWSTTFEVDGSRYYLLYFLDGSRMIARSVTSICGGVRLKSYLDVWEDQKIDELGLEGFRVYMDELADEGTLLHSLIQRKINGIDVVRTFDISDDVWRKFESFCRWVELRSPKFLWTEKVLFSLSKEYAGRADGSCEINGRKILIDFKSAKRATDSHRLQVSSYFMAAKEMGDPHDGVLVLCLGAENEQGFSETYLEPRGKCKKSEKKISPIAFYYKGFLLKKALLDWAVPLPTTIP